MAETAGVVVRPPLLYLAALVTTAGLELVAPLPLPGGNVRVLVGAVLMAAGLWLIQGAFRVFRAHETPVPTWQPTTALVTHGPYARTRNPIYVGLTLLYVGLVLLWNSGWGFAVLPFLLAVMHYGVVKREEAYLTRLFGPAYTDYTHRVRRWL